MCTFVIMYLYIYIYTPSTLIFEYFRGVRRHAPSVSTRVRWPFPSQCIDAFHKDMHLIAAQIRDKECSTLITNTNYDAWINGLSVTLFILFLSNKDDSYINSIFRFPATLQIPLNSYHIKKYYRVLKHTK